MAKVQNLSELSQSFSFTEYDFFDFYRRSFERSELGRIKKVGGILHLPLDTERLRKLTDDYVSSNAKIKRALGVEKMPVGAREGLKVTLDSFK